MFQMAIDYANFLSSKALQNLPKFGFFYFKIYHLATLLAVTEAENELQEQQDIFFWMLLLFFRAKQRILQMRKLSSR
jgi:hypothetical protein